MAYDVYDIANVCAVKLTQLDHVTNNLANAATPGFKAERMTFGLQYEDVRSALEGKPQDMPAVRVDYSQGSHQRTGNSLDVALDGEGFFVVETKEGIAYTRRGSFRMNMEGALVTDAGDAVLDESERPIKISGNSVQIDSQGQISVDGNPAGKLKIVRFDNHQNLIRNGNGLFMDPGNAEPAKPENVNVSAGYLELSNVNAIKEMVEMIDIQRTFEIYQKVIQSMNDQDKLSINRVGKLA
ncbi:MAG: flagellar basal-body rod protein FlgF [Deltaproteobacteria bacterium]|nr:flagellar basal-body rod protein FlgF [Deltaproteobacteria bacterium]